MRALPGYMPCNDEQAAIGTVSDNFNDGISGEPIRLAGAKDRSGMKKSIVHSCLVALLLIIGLGGCEKKTGYAVVIGKDYVAAEKQGAEIKDARSTDHEQWIVKVRMVDNARIIDVRADRAQWEKLRESDRVEVNYRVGKYTGTVWYAEIK
jgi:hypothetical protein